MKKLLLALATLSILNCQLSIAVAQTILPRDPAIAAAVEAISVENLRATVTDLVALHNRNNVSPAAPDRGVAAAADYLTGRLQELAAQSGGRMSVSQIAYTAGGEGERIPRPTQLLNVVATIHGSEAEGAEETPAEATPAEAARTEAAPRVIALLAHFDNRGADPLDGTSFVPGANDDGSGVAALLEIARLLPALDPRATVKLIFTSGEEHG
ncbi:MAG: M28 family peptidase, partial [Alistipes sp.]|nr:M28 family peptidase [Alistipes sp.]